MLIKLGIPFFFIHLIKADCYMQIKSVSKQSPILVSQKGTVNSIQRINILQKEIKSQYKLEVKNFSCHSLRKTFGRQVYNQNSDNAEMALVKLMELVNHTSVMITKRYLGLRTEEQMEAYGVLSCYCVKFNCSKF